MTSIKPMAGKVLPGKKPLLPANLPTLAGKVLPGRKPALPANLPPMSGSVLPKKPMGNKKYALIAATAAGVAALAVFVKNKIEKSKQENTQE